MFRNRFRFIVVCLTVMGLAGVTIAAKKKKDPLYADIEALEKKADQVFSDPAYKEGTVLNALSGIKDRSSAVSDDSLQSLMAQFQKTKSAIESEAENRKALPDNHDRIDSLAEISARYLFQQRRTLLNRFRQAHAKTGSESRFNSNDDDSYNLILPNNAGLALVQDEKYGLKLNVWHVSRMGQYDHVELGLNPQDKNDAEQAVLQEVSTEERYAKLIQLMSIRERTVNHWALQRMSSKGVLTDPSLRSCGMNLVSFSHSSTPQGDYYDFLQKYDRYEEFLKKLKKGLPEATANAPILSRSEMAKLYHRYFYALPGFDLALQMVDAQVLNDYLTNQIPQIALNRIEDLWLKNAEKILLLSSYPADVWNEAEVADRISWIAFETKKTYLIAQMAAEAQSQGVAFNAKDENELKVLAEKALGEVLTTQRQIAWREEFKKQIVAYLKSPEDVKIDAESRVARFDQIFEHVKPGIRYGSEALFVAYDAAKALKANFKNTWEKDVYAEVGGRALVAVSAMNELKFKRYMNSQALTAFMPARGLMTKRLYPWTPDQLSQFFYKKMAYMIEQKEFKKLSARAEKIAKHRIVMKGMNNLFGKISERYMAAVKAAKMNPADVTPDQNFLYQELREAIRESYADFQKMINTRPPVEKIATPTPEPKLSAKALLMAENRAVVDNLRVARPKLPIEKLKPQSDYLAPSKVPGVMGKQEEAKELFIDAISMMGLAEAALNRVAVSVPQDRFETAAFTQIEKRLRFQSVTRDAQLKDEIVRSIYDQKLIAEVVHGQMLSQYPILSIQFENKEKAARVLSKIATVNLARGSIDWTEAKALMKKAVGVAATNQKRLVTEACVAKPFTQYDESWRNVFRTAGTLRSLLQNSNPQYKDFDTNLMKSTRTWWETQLEDVIDPVAQFFFYASLIVMAVYFAPMVIGGIAGLATVGSWTVGAAGMMQSVGLTALATTEASGAFATVALAVGKQVLKTLVGKLVIWIFTAQIAVMGYVNCYELPSHLRYQLGVANSQVGIFSRTTIDREEIRQNANVIFTKQVSTGVMAVLQLTMMKPMISGMKNMIGMTTEQALARSAAYEGNEALVNGIKERTLKQLINEEGFLSGTGKWLSRSTQSLIKTGQISSLNAQAAKEDLEKIMANKMQKLFPTIESYEGMVGERLYSINESRKFLEKQIKQIRIENPSSATRFKNWMKTKMAKHLIGGKYWNIAMSERAKTLIAEDLAQTGTHSVRRVNENEVREFFIRAYEEDLYLSQEYWVQKLAILKTYKDDLAIGPSDAIMKQFLKNFVSEDFARHQELLNWVLVKTSGNLVSAKIKGWLGSTQEIREFKQIFKDHRVLTEELERMKVKVKPTKNSSRLPEKYTGEAAEEAAQAADPNAPKDWSKVDLSEAEDLIIIDVDPTTGEVTWGSKPAQEAPKAARKSFKFYWEGLFN